MTHALKQPNSAPEILAAVSSPAAGKNKGSALPCTIRDSDSVQSRAPIASGNGGGDLPADSCGIIGTFGCGKGLRAARGRIERKTRTTQHASRTETAIEKAVLILYWMGRALH
jgi:hypothetical protein